MRMIGNEGRQETRRWLNNRAEHSHQPFRRRERAMAKFRDVKALQTFASVHASIHNHFNHERHLKPPRHFQTLPSCRPGRVASTCSLRVLNCKFYRSEPVSPTMPYGTLLPGSSRFTLTMPQDAIASSTSRAGLRAAF